MLKVASFEITSDKAINELLSKYRLAPGAHILVSNGQVLIPYEDGEPETKEIKIVSQKELMYGVERQLSVVEHAQKCVEAEIADLKSDVDLARVKLASNESTEDKKQRHDTKRDLTAKLDYLEKKLREKEAQRILNNMEIARLNINISAYEAIIEGLEK